MTRPTPVPPSRFAALLRSPPLWLTLAVCAVILGVRKPDMVVRPQFWAEDGFFFERAYTVGWQAIFQPYAGYLHLIPRLIGFVAVHSDPAIVPTLFVGAAALFTLYVAARTQSARSPLSLVPWTALAVVLIPDAFEVLLTIVNLQWILGAGLLLVLISRDPERWPARVHDLVAALLLGLTGPFVVPLMPLFILRAAIRRSPISAVLAGVSVGCAAIQVWMILTHPLPQTGMFAPAYLLAAPGARILGSLAVGAFAPAAPSLVVGTLLGVVTLALVGWLALRRGDHGPERRWMALAFLFLLASALFRCRLVLPDLCQAGFGSRYFYPLQLAFVWLILLTLSDPATWIRRAAAVALAVMLLVNVPRLREDALINEHWSRYVPMIRAGKPVVVPINPDGWTMALPPRR